MFINNGWDLACVETSLNDSRARGESTVVLVFCGCCENLPETEKKRKL